MPSLTDAAAVATPTVVHIKSNYLVQSRRRNLFGDPFFDDFFGPSQPRAAQASGSGVITSPDGYIVTNNHVVNGAQSLEVILNDGRSYEAAIIGTDPSTDLAVLKIEGKDLPFLPFGNSDNVAIGEWVLAVGNPFNLSSTVTAGIVSAKARNINILKEQSAIESFIQTDAAVNPGNSGGALVNTNGELVGINTAIASPTGAYAGYSFAVPAEIVKKVVEDLMVHGIVQRAFLGAGMLELNGPVADQLGLERTQGVYIETISEEGSVGRAGVKVGDILVAVEGKEIHNAAELQEYVGRKRPGDEIEMTIDRGGKTKSITIELQNYLGTTDVVKRQKEELIAELGVEMRELTSKEKSQFNIRGGLVVLEIGEGKVRQTTDMRPGFVITSVDSQPVEDMEDFERLFRNKNGGGVMVEGIYPNRPGVYYFAFGV
ncbi:UNVERIFIED_CONTAM: hypothetical protein GTU68_037731 [Idotea baltica]|nr:hypothetical protein [Idotea baltica]